MGNSFASFHNKHVNARDYKFEVWLFLFGRVVSEMPDVPTWLAAASQEWVDLARAAPNGCIDPGFEELLTDSDRVTLFLKVCDVGLEYLRRIGPTLPAAFLNELCERGHEVGFTKDLDIETIVAFGLALKRLVAGEQRENLVVA